MAEPRKITIKLRPVGAKPPVALKKPGAPAEAKPTPESTPEAPAAPETPAPTPKAETPVAPVAAEPEMTTLPETPVAPAEQAKRQTSRIELPPEITSTPMSTPTVESEATTIKLKPVSQAAATTPESPEAVQANKSKTARIALDSVLGGIQSNTPLANTTQKTIKLKRAGAPTPKPATASAPMQAASGATPEAGSEDKTIKLKRPTTLGLKKPAAPAPVAGAPEGDGELETLEPLEDLTPITMPTVAPAEESMGAKIFTITGIVAAAASIIITIALCVVLQRQAASANGEPPTGNTLHSLPFQQLM